MHTQNNFASSVLLAISLFLTLFSPTITADTDPAEVVFGERLFLETRFSEYFYQFINNGGDYNQPLDNGDPQLDKTYRFFGLPPYQIPFADSPFKGTSYSCRTCHMVDEHADQKELGMRTYADYSSRSPVSKRSDLETTTVRNSPVLVDSAIQRTNFLLHADGEFSTLSELIIGTLTDRNFGWLPGENTLAKEHICNVVKQDNGNSDIASEFGGFSYQEIFSGKTNQNTQLPSEYLIEEQFRLDIKNSSCEKILLSLASLIEIYIDDLRFAKDETILSPYDTFLKINNLPLTPNDNEDDDQYSLRLLSSIESLEKNNKLKFVTANKNTEDGSFQFHDQVYQFSDVELEGLKVFFSKSENSDSSSGNCIACHPAPHFTDFKFHNIGVTQVEYDAIHGMNSFNKLPIPNLRARDENSEIYLPATHAHPNRQGIFRKVASKSDTSYVDLGAWNILFNSDYPNPQDKLYAMFCDQENPCKSKDVALMRSLATFKTPTLRNLGHSAPYMHNGQVSDLHAAIGFYINISNNSAVGSIRNSDHELNNMAINNEDIQPLVQFLISLYEDYN